MEGSEATEGNSYDTGAVVGSGGHNGNVVHINIPWNKLPKMPWWGYIGGFTENWQQKAVAPRVAAAYIAAGRPLTDTETEAISYWWARSAAMQGNQVPIYLASTVYFQYKSRATGRFPFYQPKDFNPLVFPSKNNPVIKGDGARILWRFLQTSAYYTVSRIAAAGFFASWAMSATSANIGRDERLQQWIHDAMQNQKKKLASPLNRTAEAMPGELPKVQFDTGETNAPQDWRAQDQDQDRGAGQTAPTPQQQTRWPNQPATPRPEALPQYQPPAAVNDDPFDDDDASPVAPAARRQQPPPPPPGSAWARVRQGQVPRPEGSAQGGSWAKARQSGSQDANQQQSYSYSESDQEKAYAQQQAQKDFDQMLEKERQGKEEKPGRRW